MKIQPLPPLHSLVAFESAARHLSFTLAAKELNVTQGAISRQVRLLEDYLGKALFTRTTRSMSLTPTGTLYFDTVRDCMLHLARTTGEIRQWRGDQQVTVATSTAMASLWLLPKVAEFQRQHEEIDLRIIAHDHVKDYSRLESDLSLYYCHTPPKGMEVTPLFSEEIFLVCSPAYLARHPQLATVEGLASCTWLWLEDSQRDWIGWPEWFKRLGQEPITPKHRVNINSYSMLIQSAISGQGVALAWNKLVDDPLSTGALVKPNDLVLRTDAQFCLLENPSERGPRESVRLFRDWLMAQPSVQAG
ncbi:LysR substrate-binding domain-containing protein [Metapseudomonas furukawaii]|uniref:Transcriptional regulator n=1 Tax=Metapseudomonas furukawaii TaxID=1149133 RepID=A0AAD1C257_METFU|nr:LysR substrate-binding domain-containing protein [Pseudomonas furukawaii]ELS25870.1 transcriptional regulator, LysR family [Pseudomonas furukawaii]BAU74688.1 transcriptional regulator [Pseudomonas furukawaii]